MPNNKIKSFFVYQVVGIVLSAITGVLGIVPLMMLRRELNKSLFVVANIAIAAALYFTKNPAMWLPYLICTMLVAIYFEAERKGYLWAGTFSVVVVFLLIVLGFYIWGNVKEINHIAWLISSLEEFIKILKGADSSVKVDVHSILKQTPSILFTLLAVTMWLGILFDRRFSGLSAIADPKSDPFLNIKTPDYFVWVAIASLLLSFVKTPILGAQEVALNVMNVILLLYFFQGLSIVAFAFVTFKVGPLWRAILYVIFVTQLFLFVSIFGILDFWLNFREKISNKAYDEDTRGDL